MNTNNHPTDNLEEDLYECFLRYREQRMFSELEDANNWIDDELFLYSLIGIEGIEV